MYKNNKIKIICLLSVFFFLENNVLRGDDPTKTNPACPAPATHSSAEEKPAISQSGSGPNKKKPDSSSHKAAEQKEKEAEAGNK